jgi:hypothetical protein
MTKRSLALAALLACSAAAVAVAAPPQIAVLARGICVGAGPIAGPWDVYEDMFQADAPTWLPAHTHRGIECTLGVRGTTMWWFHAAGKRAVPPGTALLTPQGRVHTAGNDGPAPMTYFATHILVAGSPYRTLVADPTAPTQVSTNGKSLFHSVFADQRDRSNRPGQTFTTILFVESLPSGARIGTERPSYDSDGPLYYTVISGRVMVDGKVVGQYGHWIGGDVSNPGPGAAVLGVVRIVPTRS